MGIEENFLNLIKNIFIANIIIKDELLKVFLLMSTRQGCLQSPFLFDIKLEVLASIIRQEKKIKGIKIRKEGIRHSLFADDMIIYMYMKNTGDSTD